MLFMYIPINAMSPLPQVQVQSHPQPAIAQTSTGPSAPSPPAATASPYAGLYPNLQDEYMGLDLVQFRTVSR